MWLSSQNLTKICKKVLSFSILTIFSIYIAGCGSINITQLDKPTYKNMRAITVKDINSRTGLLYGRELRKLLHLDGKESVKYILISEILTNSSSTLSVQGTGSNLKKMTMTASFQLNDFKTGKTLITDNVIGDATFGVVTSLYSQEKSETHARERLAILLAKRVVRRLQIYFLDKNKP